MDISTKTQLQQAIQFQNQQQFHAAKDIYLNILESNPNEENALHLLGVVMGSLGFIQQGIDLITQAIQVSDEPCFAYYRNIAPLYRAIGKFDIAEKYYLKALEKKPNLGEALRELSELRLFSEKDNSILKQILELITQPTSRQNLSHLHFAAGKIFDDLGQYERAFHHIDQANHLMEINYQPEYYEKLSSDIQNVFKSIAVKSTFPKRDDNFKTPVFIVGMPRSGTTLLHEILATHDYIYGAGETLIMPEVVSRMNTMTQCAYPNFLSVLTKTKQNKTKQNKKNLNKTLCDNIVDAYQKRITSISNETKTKFFVDKYPENFFYIGLILMLFPEAKIIHAMRNPLATCLSCYFKRFSQGNAYSFNLEHLSHYYLIYIKTMKFWNEILPDKIFNIQYEKLINDLPGQSKALFDFIGIEWKADNARFYDSSNSVKTASFSQVRKPLYRSALNHYQHYIKHIDLLCERFRNLDYPDE